VLTVGGDAHKELLLAVKLGRVGEGCISDFVQGIGGVGNQFTKKDFFVGVEGVDDKVKELW
jgi:hypothetical protein